MIPVDERDCDGGGSSNRVITNKKNNASTQVRSQLDRARRGDSGATRGAFAPKALALSVRNLRVFLLLQKTLYYATFLRFECMKVGGLSRAEVRRKRNQLTRKKEDNNEKKIMKNML